MSSLKNISSWMPSTLFNWGMNQEEVIIQLDSSITRWSIGNQKVVEQPTLLAVDKQRNSLGGGNMALALRDKISRQLQVIQPIHEFSVHSRWAMSSYLDLILNTSNSTLADQVFGKRTATVSVNYGLFPLHLRVIEEELSKLGIVKTNFLTHSQAAFYSLPAAVRQQPVAIMLIAGSTTEVVMVDDGKILVGTVIPLGSEHFSQAIKEAILKKYQLEVSDQVVNQIKKSLPTKLAGLEKWKSLVRGKDIVQSLPTSLTISSEFMAGLFDEYYQELIEATKQMFAQLSSQLVTHTLEKGLYVFGKESQLPGIKMALEEGLNSEIFCLPSNDLILEGQRVYSKEKNTNKNK